MSFLSPSTGGETGAQCTLCTIDDFKPVKSFKQEQHTNIATTLLASGNLCRTRWRGCGRGKQGPKVDVAGHDNLVSGQEGPRQGHLKRIPLGLMLEAGSTRQLLGTSDFKHECDLWAGLSSQSRKPRKCCRNGMGVGPPASHQWGLSHGLHDSLSYFNLRGPQARGGQASLLLLAASVSE